ncbi:prenyltransferase/squalene oxidase repeat-containing protein [Actinomadura terrae]|uniref:prenyltransferase/squalene oxidase repeat-containing protein n=1 Tax=Actinomadura terrae TaxID=604353 RepID=UPI001FA7A20E|nr:prenyltransferase/squalene oxidase repeat-containing protein [Actinomadura terrae]
MGTAGEETGEISAGNGRGGGCALAEADRAPATGAAARTRAGAQALVAGLTSEPWGQVSPSVYETGRLVSLAPWLTGHEERLRFLLAAQRQDGGWGARDGYAIVPTLSATEGVLSSLRARDSGLDPQVLARAADRGLRAADALLTGGRGRPVPDMPAIELISAYLTELLNGHLAALDAAPISGLDAWLGGARLSLPHGWDGALLEPIRARIAAGRSVPTKMVHALEIAGPAARGSASVSPGPRTGAVGASPAATAAWLGGSVPPPGDRARRFLERAARLHGGPVPCGLPITVFEQAWTLSGTVRAGVPIQVPEGQRKELAAALGPEGTPAGEGLPADADTTAVTLYTLALLGAPHEPDSLLAFELDEHFCTWQGEQGASVTTNAHVLDAFGQYVKSRPAAAPRYARAIAKAASWLLGQQRPDGSWSDRWHVSPYYATACATAALRSFGGEAAREPVRRALRWVVDTQRVDGSWGLWDGTAEETAQAVQALLLGRGAMAGMSRSIPSVGAAVRGRAWLERFSGRTSDPPLWHDKDLYLPRAIVRGTVLAALHLAR